MAAEGGSCRALLASFIRAFRATALALLEKAVPVHAAGLAALVSSRGHAGVDLWRLTLEDVLAHKVRLVDSAVAVNDVMFGLGR